MPGPPASDLRRPRDSRGCRADAGGRGDRSRRAGKPTWPPVAGVRALRGLGLLFLPVGLLASHVGGAGLLAKAGSACLASGICLASLVDVPSALDPADTGAGGAWGPVGLALLSAGFLAWFAAVSGAGVLGGWRRWVFLVAGLWFFATFPAVQLPLFVVPTGRPSFILLAGVLGDLQALMGIAVREQAGARREAR